MANMILTKSEEELMGFLWAYGKPLSVPEILEECPEHRWSDHYLRVMLSSLERKGIVGCSDFDKRGKQYARRFHCIVSREEFFSNQAQMHGLNTKDFMRIEAAAMFEKGDKAVVQEIVSELTEMIKAYEASEDGDE